MIQLAFAAFTFLLWVSISILLSVIFDGKAQDDDDAEFDMTIEMSRSRGVSLHLLATGVSALVIALFTFFAFELI